MFDCTPEEKNPKPSLSTKTELNKHPGVQKDRQGKHPGVQTGKVQGNVQGVTPSTMQLDKEQRGTEHPEIQQQGGNDPRRQNGERIITEYIITFKRIKNPPNRKVIAAAKITAKLPEQIKQEIHKERKVPQTGKQQIHPVAVRQETQKTEFSRVKVKRIGFGRGQSKHVALPARI